MRRNPAGGEKRPPDWGTRSGGTEDLRGVDQSEEGIRSPARDRTGAMIRAQVQSRRLQSREPSRGIISALVFDDCHSFSFAMPIYSPAAPHALNAGHFMPSNLRSADFLPHSFFARKWFPKCSCLPRFALPKAMQFLSFAPQSKLNIN